MGYREDARADAVSTVENYEDEIVEMLADDGKASDDLLNDYGSGDSYHHESHVDKFYDLTEAAELLDELSDYEETDSGLWQGLEPRRAIAAQAAYTYGNAVYSFFSDLIGEINDAVADALDTLGEKHNEEIDTAEAEVAKLREELTEELAEARDDGASDDEIDELQSRLDAIEDYDADDYEDAHEAEKKTVIRETVKECCSNF